MGKGKRKRVAAPHSPGFINPGPISRASATPQAVHKTEPAATASTPEHPRWWHQRATDEHTHNNLTASVVPVADAPMYAAWAGRQAGDSPSTETTTASPAEEDEEWRLGKQAGKPRRRTEPAAALHSKPSGATLESWRRVCSSPAHPAPRGRPTGGPARFPPPAGLGLQPIFVRRNRLHAVSDAATGCAPCPIAARAPGGAGIGQRRRGRPCREFRLEARTATAVVTSPS